MGIFENLINFVLHLDTYLSALISQFGIWTYAILFLIIFMETGFVVTPFLPGDSLLFAAGTFAARGDFNILVLFVILFLAAVIGDTVNYWIGNYLGLKVFEKNYRFIKKEHLVKIQNFFEKHGGKAIILARFVPIVRTFAPFVAGIGTMQYKRFLAFNVVGGFIWVVLFVFTGYFFGNIPVVQHNFEVVVIVIIGVSLVPMIFEYVKSKRSKEKIDKEDIKETKKELEKQRVKGN